MRTLALPASARQQVTAGLGPESMLRLILKGTGPPTFFEPRVPTKAPDCCNLGKVLRTLRLLPAREVADIVAKNERVEVRCEFCGRVRVVPARAVQRHLDAAAAAATRGVGRQERERTSA